MRLGKAAAIYWGGLFLVAVSGPVTLQQFEGLTSPEVAAIKNHPVRATATVTEPLIDGIGGDPALAYRYTVSGRTYDGFDIANAETGDVLGMEPGDPVSIIYAASMPNVSCLEGSSDCPNDIYDPAIPAFGFWLILIGGSLLGGLLVGVIWVVRTRFPSRSAT